MRQALFFIMLPLMPHEFVLEGGHDPLDLLRDERDRAIEALRLIEEEGWTHYEAQGPGDTARDVTDSVPTASARSSSEWTG
jgi:hypothetical protein